MDLDDFGQWFISGELGNGVVLECPLQACSWSYTHPFVTTAVIQLMGVAQRHVRWHEPVRRYAEEDHPS